MIEIIRVSPLLRFVLLADAATCFGFGILLAGGGAFLETLVGLPASLMFYAGIGLFPFGALLAYTALRKSVSKTLVWLIVGLNLLWTIDSLLLVASGYAALTAFGVAFVVLQALGVAVFALLEFYGLRRAEVVVFQNTV